MIGSLYLDGRCARPIILTDKPFVLRKQKYFDRVKRSLEFPICFYYHNNTGFDQSTVNISY